MRNIIRTTRRTRLLLVAILALSGCGAWLSGEMLKQQDDLWGQAGASGLLARVCEATQQWGFNCTAAAKGPWANVRLPMLAWSGRPHAHLVTFDIPIAFAGLAYFVFVAVWFGFVGRPRVFGRRWFFVPIAAVSVGAVGSTTYMALMALKIAPWCSACVLLHAINFMMIAAIGLLCVRKTSIPADGSMTPAACRPAGLTLTAREALGAVAFSFVLIAGLWEYRSEHLALRDQWRKLVPYKTLVNELRDDRVFLLCEHRTGPLQAWGVAGEADCDDRPRLDVFIDYECPGCACRTTDVIEQAKAAFGDQLQVVIRHFPLCQSCNPAVKSKFHKNACLAAYAAEAARFQGGDQVFWKMHDRLIRYPGELKPDVLRELAGQIGLDQERFLADLQGDAVRNVVASHVEMGRQWGVSGTPTLFINGRRVNQNFEGPTFWQVVADDWASNLGAGLTSALPKVVDPVAGPALAAGRE